MSSRSSRLGARARVAWAIVLGLVAGVAAPAAATPVTVYFDGPSGYGVAEAVALASGVPIEAPDYVIGTPQILSVVDQVVDVGSIDPFPPIAASGNTATSSWTVQNTSPYDLLGDTFFVFLRTVPYEGTTKTVAYDGSDLGLTIDPDLGWVLIHTNAGPGQDYYFPAMSLGSLAPGERAQAFDVNFVLDAPLLRVGNEFVLPRFEIATGFAPIPEPAGATLMGLGLALLAALRERRA